MTVLRDDGGAVRGTVGLVRNISRRERREDLLSRLQETTQSLMQAPDRETVAEIVADAAVDRLGFEACVVRLYDADERTLVPVARVDDSGAGTDGLPTLGLEEGPAADVFTSGEPAGYDDLADIEAATADGRGAPVLEASDACGAIFHPIGVHGTLALGTGRPGGVDDVDRQIAGLLATNGAAACNRARRERELRDAREHVATIVDRIEGLVEDTIEVLVGARTREDVERGVCERLAATDPYTSAWLARPDVRETALAPAEHAGEEPTIQERRIDIDGDDPAAVAYRTGTPQVVDRAALADATGGWPAAARARGVAAAVAIPLAHRQDSFGVLVVCSDHEAVFEERELVVLEALGRAVADAIDAIESGRILETDEIVERAI
jgi:GAF domain-containing protein